MPDTSPPARHAATIVRGVNFLFALNQRVALADNPAETGRVIAQLASVHTTDMYQVAYTSYQGEFREAWFYEGQITAVSDATNIDAAHRAERAQTAGLKAAADLAEARLESLGVARDNVAASVPKPAVFSLGAFKLGKNYAELAHECSGRVALERGGASVSLYIPDIDQKPGEPIADFLLRAAAALQGQAASL